MRIIKRRVSTMDVENRGNRSQSSVVDLEGHVVDLSVTSMQGVLHHDLKPENFLVERNPFFRAVINDFGFAKVVTSNTKANVLPEVDFRLSGSPAKSLSE